MEGYETSQHVLQHSIPSMKRVLECFEEVPAKEISKSIAKMGQRELQVAIRRSMCAMVSATHLLTRAGAYMACTLILARSAADELR